MPGERIARGRAHGWEHRKSLALYPDFRQLDRALDRARGKRARGAARNCMERRGDARVRRANKDEGYLDVEPGDVATVPTHMFRGFEKRDEGTGFLFVVLGHDDPGKVVWAPSVFKMAEDFGLKLLKGGKLVDTTLGETVPEGAEMEQPPDAAESWQASWRRRRWTSCSKYAVKAADMKGNPELAAGRRGRRGSGADRRRRCRGRLQGRSDHRPLAA